MSSAFGRKLGFTLVLFVLSACAGAEFQPEIPELPAAPMGLDRDLMATLPDPSATPELVALGWQLFYDSRLSSDGTVSCASCHISGAGFADPRPGSVGVGGQVGGRNAPPVINAAFNAMQFWDGRSPSLEDQALGPIQNPIEMANTLEAAEETLNGIPGYVSQVRNIFGVERVTSEHIAQSISAFERLVLSGDSPWDRWEIDRDSSAVSEAALRGGNVFRNEGRCDLCHSGTNFSDSDAGLFHNIGVGMDSDEPDLGRYGVTGADEDRGAFKTPTLRNVTQTSPYMHDGGVATLEEVIDFYIRGGVANEWLDPKMQPLNLTDGQKSDLLAFLRSLTGSVPEWTMRAPPLP